MNAAVVMERDAIAPAPPTLRARRSFKPKLLADSSATRWKCWVLA
jgi:hypothetical protein